MRTTTNISVTLPTAMAKEARRLAKHENRTVSELMREAFRRYRDVDAKELSADAASILQIVADAKAHPLSAQELEVEDRRLMAVGAAQAKKVGIRERDAVRVVHQSRARRSAS